MSEAQDQQFPAEWKRFVSELRHRLMNNLQMIMSVINVQVSQADEPRVAAALRATQNRVRAITGVLGRYSTPDLTAVHFGNYLQWLIRELVSDYDVSGRIETDVSASDIAVSIDDGIPLALIVNELVANALEHAFPDGASGKIRVCLAYAAADEYGELEVSDNGKPLLTGEFDSGEKTGFTLLRTLTLQVHGKIALENGADGKPFRLTFPL
jgi:two-component sensor histidine kinase